MSNRYTKYINSPVSYKEDKLTSEHFSYPIMGQHETPIMEESAKIVCQNGGRILNVGFGMGIIDSFIKTHHIQEHHIVDAHPDVIKKAREMGFGEDEILYESDWRDLIPQWNDKNFRFDGIYFDTMLSDWKERPEWSDFSYIVDSILKEGGIFSFFNNFATSPKLSQPMWDKLKELKYTKYTKFISYNTITKQANHPQDMNHLKREDYELVWYIKPFNSQEKQISCVEGLAPQEMFRTFTG